MSLHILPILTQDWDWFNGRNFCRDRCMDLVSFDTPGEFKMFEEIMARGKGTLGNIEVKAPLYTARHQSMLCLRSGV